MDKYVTRKEFLKVIVISYNTLLKLRRSGEIETIKIGKKIFYNLNKFLLDKGIKRISGARKNIIYCRVSSTKQKEDLIRQANYLKELYPNHLLISEIGSGMNNKRAGFIKIIDLAIKGEINEVVVTYKDRLCRFGFELIENIIKKYSNGKIKVLKNKKSSVEEKMTEDILAIMNVYVAKINGIRSHSVKSNRNKKNILK